MHLLHKRQSHKQPNLCSHRSVVTFVVVLRTCGSSQLLTQQLPSAIAPLGCARLAKYLQNKEQDNYKVWRTQSRREIRFCELCCCRAVLEHSIHAGVSWALWDSCPGSWSSQEVTESINNCRYIMIMENIAKWRYGCCYETQWEIQALAWNCTEWTGLFGLHMWHKVIASKYLLSSVLPLPGFLPYTLT